MDAITDFFHELFHDAWRMRVTLGILIAIAAAIGLYLLWQTRCPHCARFFALDEVATKDFPDRSTFVRYRCKRCGKHTWKDETERNDTNETYWNE